MVVQQDVHTCICQRVSLYHIVRHYEIITCHRTKLHHKGHKRFYVCMSCYIGAYHRASLCHRKQCGTSNKTEYVKRFIYIGAYHRASFCNRKYCGTNNKTFLYEYVKRFI